MTSFAQSAVAYLDLIEGMPFSEKSKTRVRKLVGYAIYHGDKVDLRDQLQDEFDDLMEDAHEIDPPQYQTEKSHQQKIDRHHEAADKELRCSLEYLELALKPYMTKPKPIAKPMTPTAVKVANSEAKGDQEKGKDEAQSKQQSTAHGTGVDAVISALWD